jgi:uncharacterized membrane protein
MSSLSQRWPAALALLAALLGLTFGSLSSLDYIQHLDRQVHDVHCSYIPGLGAEQSPDNACRVAMYSPYAAVLRDRYWGGVPISLFAVGAFGFFAAFALYVLLAGRAAPRRALLFLAVASIAPVAVSILMGTISALKLGHFCKTCVGIYVSSALLAIGSITAWAHARRERPWSPASATTAYPAGALSGPAPGGAPNRRVPPTVPGDAERTAVDPEMAVRPDGAWWMLLVWGAALAAFAAVPALLYTSALPGYRTFITSCGKLEKPAETTGALLHVPFPSATQPATLFVDPLCPTCKAFHQRLAAEGLLDKLDLTVVLFPLDSECNWMLDRPVHPGACMVSRAILCSDHRALPVLEWAYDHQDEILTAAKAGAGTNNVHAMIRQRWPGLEACMDAKETKIRLDHMLRYIVNNHLQVSTPQMFVGETRLCDEDTDMGLSYTLRRLAPGLRDR